MPVQRLPHSAHGRQSTAVPAPKVPSTPATPAYDRLFQPRTMADRFDRIERHMAAIQIELAELSGELGWRLPTHANQALLLIASAGRFNRRLQAYGRRIQRAKQIERDEQAEGRVS